MQRRKIVFVGIEKWDKTPKGRVVPEESVVEVVQAVHGALGHAGAMPTRRELESGNFGFQVVVRFAESSKTAMYVVSTTQVREGKEWKA